jgi:hypothetical protein
MRDAAVTAAHGSGKRKKTFENAYPAETISNFICGFQLPAQRLSMSTPLRRLMAKFSAFSHGCFEILLRRRWRVPCD